MLGQTLHISHRTCLAHKRMKAGQERFTSTTVTDDFLTFSSKPTAPCCDSGRFV